MPKPRLAKLTRPRLHGAVPRERLFRLLDQKREHPVVWLTGPPGSGKTTLVASYLGAASVPAVWYLLDKGDSDPATFFYYLAQAVTAASRKRSRPLPLLTPEYLPDLEGFSRRFMRDAFARLPQGSLMVVDNYHEIADESALHKMLNAAVSEIPHTANLIVVSRTQPPAIFSRAKIAGDLHVLGWDALRLDAAETAAIVERRKPAAREMIDAIHIKSGGWVAGVRLMMQGDLRTEAVAALDQPEALESAFDYFAAEVFESAPEELQNVLLRTAFLPRFTVKMAEKICGDEQAGKRIEQMFRRRLFIDRRLGDETTYQYHDLFRAFLQNRAGQTFTSDEVASLTSRSASLLLESHLTDEAFALFAQARDWDQAKRLFLEQAQALIAHGRWITLDEWGGALPAAYLESDPWLSYWLGRSKALVDAAEAFSILEAAYESFREKLDNYGQLLCAATVVETLHFVTGHWDAMGKWLERLMKCLENQDARLSPDDELRVHAALFWAADPTSRVAVASVAKSVGLLPQCVDVNLRVSVANMLHYHADRTLDARVSEIATREARSVLDSQDLSADRHALYYLAEGFAHVHFARCREAIQCCDRADAIIKAHGLVGRKRIASVWRALCHYAAGEVSAARTTLERTDNLNVRDLDILSLHLENTRAWVAFGRGALVTALEHSQAAIQVAIDIEAGRGTYARLSQLLAYRAYMLIAAGQHGLARQALGRIGEAAWLVDYGHVGGAKSLLDSWYALRSGDMKICLMALRESLQLASDARDRLRMRWYPNALKELLPVAMERGIETDMARTLIRECGIVPPSSAPESWPWPIRIYTLGRFEILIDDKAPEYGRKSPKRTLALLKALIALGEVNVPEQSLADLLWPDLEGDSALESLSSALHRLRRLLGNNDAVLQSGGTLSVNQQRCFVDMRALEDGRENGQVRLALIELYRGDFLASDGDVPWAVSMRERLRGKFIRAVESQGQEYETAAAYDDAIGMYLRGVETDELVELFYCGLMRCYAKLGRNAEAAGIFRRLRQTLSITLGTTPAPETQRLFEEIGLSRERSS